LSFSLSPPPLPDGHRNTARVGATQESVGTIHTVSISKIRNENRTTPKPQQQQQQPPKQREKEEESSPPKTPSSPHDSGLRTKIRVADETTPSRTKLLKNPMARGDLKIPTPVFVVNLPKTATTTLHSYFNCGLGRLDGTILPSVHWRHPVRTNATYIKELEETVLEKKGDLDTMGNVWRYHPGGVKKLPKMGATMALNVKWGLPLLSNRPFELLRVAIEATTPPATATAATTTTTPVWEGTPDGEHGKTPEEYIDFMHEYYGRAVTHFFRTTIGDTDFVDRSLGEETFFVNFDCQRPTMFLATDALENIAEHYPHATIVYIDRDPAAWYSSANRWGKLLDLIWTGGGSSALTDRLLERETTRTTSHEEEDDDDTDDPPGESAWMRFYENYRDHVRSFARDHPSLTFLDLKLDDDTGEHLEELVGIPSECWGHENKNRGRARKRGGNSNNNHK